MAASCRQQIGKFLHDSSPVKDEWRPQKFEKYVGSFPVTAVAEDEDDVHNPTKADYVRAQLERMRQDDKQRRPVLLVISLSGIKMCSVDGKNVLMAHALRRISYATCDSANRQFSFLAREPKGHFSLQHCHSFVTESTNQAEELNAIVGNAFRAAYLAQLQRDAERRPLPPPPPPLQPSSSPPALLPPPPEDNDDDDDDRNQRYCRLIGDDQPTTSEDDGDDQQRTGRSASNRLPISRSSTVAGSGGNNSERRAQQYQYRRLHNSHRSRRRSPHDNLNNLRRDGVGLSPPVATTIRTRNLNAIRDWTQLVKPDIEGNIEEAVDPVTALADMNALSARDDDDDSVGDSNGNPAIKGNVVAEKPQTLPGLHLIDQRQHLTVSAEGRGEVHLAASSGDEQNSSPTELNCYRRLVDKPPLGHKQPLVQQLLLTPVSTDNSPDDNEEGEEELRPLVKSPCRTLDAVRTVNSGSLANNIYRGYVNEALVTTRCEAPRNDPQGISRHLNSESSTPQTDVKMHSNVSSPPSSEGGYMDQSSDGSQRRLSRLLRAEGSPFIIREQRTTAAASENDDAKTRGRRTSDGQNSACSRYSSSSGSSSNNGRSNFGTPPPLPDRYDSLQSMTMAVACEETELRRAGWFQAGIPRDVALEILSQEPVGSFMVRASESKPGCFALSLRVPRPPPPPTPMSNDNCGTNGIAHYLIMRTNRGYKIKGFTKEFNTLTALITHHSVMPELLPCPLNLSRYNPSFSKHDSNQDFADLNDGGDVVGVGDDHPDENAMADFCKMMADVSGEPRVQRRYVIDGCSNSRPSSDGSCCRIRPQCPIEFCKSVTSAAAITTTTTDQRLKNGE